MSDKFLDGTHITASQWMVLDCITRALREHFVLHLTKLPHITFTLVECRNEPVCVDNPHYRYEITSYFGKGNVGCSGEKSLLGVWWGRTYGDHLPANSEGAYLNTFFVTVKRGEVTQYKKFSVGFDGQLKPETCRWEEVPAKLQGFAAQ